MLKKALADKLTKIAVQQYDAGVKFKQPRLEAIKKSEDQYNGRRRPSLKGRFNVPLPIMSGYIDTLMAKIDDVPRLNFGHQDLADYKRAKKVTSLWVAESAPTKGAWGRKDRAVKKMACFSGRGIYKIYADRPDGKYESHLEVVDYHDFIAEPNGGGHLESHLFCGQENIFRTKSALETGAENGVYDTTQVGKLIAGITVEDHKRNEDLHKNKINRMQALGLDPESNSFVGQDVYNLVEWAMDYEGERYYLLFNHKTGIWIRAEKLSDVVDTNLYPWVTWATNEEAFNFWSKAPADDIRPVADAMMIAFNQDLENRQKINWGMKAIDPSVFPDPGKLQWDRPDKIVVAKKGGGAIGSGIYEFKTPALSGGLNLVQYLDNFLGQKTGITPSAQGVSDKDAKVGVYFGDLQQVADRLGLLNKSYNDAWAELGERYYHGLKENLREPQAVEIIGERGVEWDEVVRDDVRPSRDFNITVTGGNAEAQSNEVKKRRRAEALAAITANPSYAEKLSPQWIVEQYMRNGDFSEDEIRVAMDKDNYGAKEILSEASQAIQELLAGKEPKPNRGATTAYIQKIIDFAVDNVQDDLKFMKMMNFAQQHVPIAIENAGRLAHKMIAQEGLPQDIKGGLRALDVGMTEREEQAQLARPNEVQALDGADGRQAIQQEVSAALLGA